MILAYKIFRIANHFKEHKVIENIKVELLNIKSKYNVTELKELVIK